MSSYIYWNDKNSDCKHIFAFMKDPQLTDILSDKNVHINRVHSAKDAEATFCADFSNASTVIFLTHGTTDAILQYRTKSYQDIHALINVASSECLAKKVVIAICCDSAQDLGRFSVSREDGNACVSYLGFSSPIFYNHLNEDKGANQYNDDEQRIIYKVYSDIFKNALGFSYGANPTVRNVFLMMKREMESSIILIGQEIRQLHRKESSVDLFADIYNNTIGKSAEGLVVLGNQNTKVFQ
jgi:hypothetical protein